MMAAKLEEVYAPTVDDMVDISANTFDHKEFVEYEMIVSRTLEFRLTAVTPFNFLTVFLRAAHANPRMANFVWYIAELALQDYAFTGVKASKLAAAVGRLVEASSTRSCATASRAWT